MRYRLRTLLPGQFGLLALFIVMTAAAVALAFARLPIPTAAKLGPLAVMLCCFSFWMAKTMTKR